jgi:hypothetical protein
MKTMKREAVQEPDNPGLLELREHRPQFALWEAAAADHVASHAVDHPEVFRATEYGEVLAGITTNGEEHWRLRAPASGGDRP